MRTTGIAKYFIFIDENLYDKDTCTGSVRMIRIQLNPGIGNTD